MYCIWTEDKAVLYSLPLTRRLITSLWEDGVKRQKQVMSASNFSNERHPTKFYNLCSQWYKTKMLGA